MKNILATILLLTTTAVAQWRPFTAAEIRARQAYGNAVLYQGLRNAARPLPCRPRVFVQPGAFRRSCGPTRVYGGAFINRRRVSGVIGLRGRWGGITIGF